VRLGEKLRRYRGGSPSTPQRDVPERDRHTEERLAHVENEGFPDDAPPLDGETTEIRCHAEKSGRHGNEGRAEEEDDPVIPPGVEDPPPPLRQGVVPPLPDVLVSHEIRIGENTEVLMNGRPGKTEPVGELAHRHGPGIEQFEDRDPDVGGESGEVVLIDCDVFHSPA